MNNISSCKRLSQCWMCDKPNLKPPGLKKKTKKTQLRNSKKIFRLLNRKGSDYRIASENHLRICAQRVLLQSPLKRINTMRVSGFDRCGVWNVKVLQCYSALQRKPTQIHTHFAVSVCVCVCLHS